MSTASISIKTNDANTPMESSITGSDQNNKEKLSSQKRKMTQLVDSNDNTTTTTTDKQKPPPPTPPPPLPIDISPTDLTTTITTLQKITTTPSSYTHPTLRPLRKTLAAILKLQQAQMYDGKSPSTYKDEKMEERTLKRQKMAEKRRQRQYLDATALRRKRVENLERLKDDGRDEELKKIELLMIPDGAVVEDDDDGGDKPTASSVPLLTNGTTTTTTTTTPTDDNNNNDPNPPTTDNNTTTSTPKTLPHLRSCYVCKIRYRQLHHFYDQLCPPCATLNYTKRHTLAPTPTTPPLPSHAIAIVTGARVKIGFQTGLKLLRSKSFARVIALTRFPMAAARAYAAEKDFDEWKGRLDVYGLDLRDVVGVEMFCSFVKERYGRCDVLINNACQTIRRPVGYYRPMVEGETKVFERIKGEEEGEGEGGVKEVLKGCWEFEERRGRMEREQKERDGGRIKNDNQLKQICNGENDGGEASSTTLTTTTTKSTTLSSSSSFAQTGISHSAQMSQTPMLPIDSAASSSVISSQITDINAQPIDLRKTNSWLLQIQDISTPEILETLLINTIAPFVLNSRLIPLMQQHQDTKTTTTPKYIINVSAMEGKFYRYKMPNHPHTNMAKAALNMMTRTSAEELATKYNIYMNSVDTGWINDENPLERAAKTAKVNHFQTPIDEVDAAARVLDPVWNGMREFGKFFKDYKETEW